MLGFHPQEPGGYQRKQRNSLATVMTSISRAQWHAHVDPRQCEHEAKAERSEMEG
jgi:hypothetical protein